ncbi:MAG: type II toxin-antitoxin system HicA family toxin [Deltaproteobacteria bacterium]|nr:type II toxin-antitoxin system HicA family toxin [Deltaproteobacteria bacterium]
MDGLVERARNNPQSLSFKEIQRLVDLAGFRLKRVRGSHHVYTRKGIVEITNIQPKGKMAKPYQVRQVVSLIDKYGLLKEK